MKTNGIITLLAGMWLAGCAPKDPAPNPAGVRLDPNEDVSALYPQFHGKYEVVSSTSSEALDVNLDGKASDDMMLEIPALTAAQGQQYSTELRIYGPSQYSQKPNFIFTQWWPEQSIRISASEFWDNNQLINYTPNYVVNHDMQGTSRLFSFSPDLKQILVKPNENEDSFRWGRPESVTVEANGQLRVVNKRRLYTRAGVKEVMITTVYERYTMST